MKKATRIFAISDIIRWSLNMFGAVLVAIVGIAPYIMNAVGFGAYLDEAEEFLCGVVVEGQHLFDEATFSWAPLQLAFIIAGVVLWVVSLILLILDAVIIKKTKTATAKRQTIAVGVIALVFGAGFLAPIFLLATPKSKFEGAAKVEAKPVEKKAEEPKKKEPSKAASMMFGKDNPLLKQNKAVLDKINAKKEAKKEEEKVEAEPAKEPEVKEEAKEAPKAVKANKKPVVEKEVTPEPKPVEEKPVEPVAEEKKAVEGTKVYHISKRASDQRWVVKFAGGSKVIKSFATKKEAVAYTDELAKNQEAVVLTHASKGAKAGKIYEKTSDYKAEDK